MNKNFITKIINLKNDLNKKSLRDNLNIFLKRSNNQYIYILIKIRTSYKNKVRILSLTKGIFLDLQNSEEINNYKQYVLAQFENKMEHYKSLIFSGLFFDYNILDKESYGLNENKNPWTKSKINLKEFPFPLTVNYSELAKEIKSSTNITYYSDCHGFKDAQFAIFNVTNIIDNEQTAIYLVNLKIKGNNYNFNDMLNKETAQINRIFTDGSEINNVFKLDSIKLDTQFIPKKTFDMLQEESNGKWQLPTFKACTLDCETYLDDESIQHLMSVAIYDGKNEFWFFIKDYNSVNDMIKEIIIKLLSYNGYNIYIHNGAKFDLFFLLKHFIALKDELKIDFDIIYKDGEFLDLKIFNENCRISIKDSYKLLIASLSDLVISFGIETPKGSFPFDFAKPENFNYIGNTPDIKYFAFDGKPIITQEEYNSLVKDNWNFIEELKKYNILDCKILYYIILKFFELIKDKFHVDMKKNPTLSSLAFSMFKTSFIPQHLKTISKNEKEDLKTGETKVFYELKSEIDILNSNLDNFIREGYFGGHVDAYIPHFDNSLPEFKDQILHQYDAVSLYPSVMVSSDLPYKINKHYVGNLLEARPELFEGWLGFHRVRVFCPNDLINPILPVRNSKGIVLYPTGTWTGIYFSEEIKNAMKYGYKFEFLEGYIFFGDPGVFTDYINDLFNLKQNSLKGSAMYLIGKLLMNSLFGKFGIHQELPNYSILNKEQINEYLETNKLRNITIGDEINITDNYSLINFSSDTTSPEANVALAAAITSYARIHMSQFFNDPNHPLFYTDTDSTFTTKPLSENLVGKNLGQMALENKFNKFICLGPKMYAGVTVDGKEIVKIKGLPKDNLPTYSEIETLLENGKYLMRNDINKSFKDLSLAQILLKKSSYLLKPTANKRDFIYSGTRIIGTKNKILKE